MIARLDWYREHGVEIHIGDRANKIDRKRCVVTSDKDVSIQYDAVVLATGSYPFVPPVDGIQRRGVFVYRTIADLEKIIEYGQSVRRCAVIGGGLLGLEAAKAAFDLGLETHVVEFAPRLMPRQIDDAGSGILVRKIEELGVRVHLNKAATEVTGGGCVGGITFTDGDTLEVDMIIVSAGIRPRDELARDCGLDVGERGGVAVNDRLQTSDSDIYAVGEVALHGGMVYGLVAPGYEMAETVAANLCGADRKFTGADLSTKLKLLGVDVASFGDYDAGPDRAQPLVFEVPFAGVYKKLFFDREGKRLLGGILVGDAADYSLLSALAKSGDPLPCSPGELMGVGGGAWRSGRHERRRPSLFVQQRQQRGNLCRDCRAESHVSRRRQVMHQGRRRLRRLSAVGHRHLPNRNVQSRRRDQQSPLRALRLCAARVVRNRQDQPGQDVRRVDRFARHR